ncbi:MAG: cytochrome C [Methyloprofundus sp.]|nr:cytochrome C [Methyloprofundus sp.]
MSTLLMFLMFSNGYAAANQFDKPVNHPPIPLLDEQGKHVLESNNPYSPKKSCEGSGCHDYEAITHAYHFEMGRDESSDNYGAKRGLPHLVSPGYYGGYVCMGGNNPQVLAKKNNAGIEDFADYGSAGWVKSCMSCHTGGGWAEKDRDGIRYDEKNVADIKPGDGDYYERHEMNGKEHLMLWDWKKSGVGEADCMMCHVDFAALKLPEDSGLTSELSPRRARQAFTTKGFFRQAASGLMEYIVNDEGKNILTVERAMQPNPGMHGAPGIGESIQPVLDAQGMPKFKWHADAFDANGRVTIPMLRFPGNDNCMECHITSNSRRGFYGFGESAAATIANAGEDAADGTLEDDYKDDVHKGKMYTDDNGQVRDLENCNACHSKQYFKSPLENIDLDANHNFPKGNSDMDVRNDLDYAPNAKSCEECHINAKNKVIPSGHDTLLDAHRELWKGAGDMAGYSKDSLTKITQTHFDVVSCQACHINDKKSNGKPIQLLFRYREAEDGKSKMVPYNPRLRARWLDKTSGRVLAKTERNSVFEKGEDADGNSYGIIKDPISGAELGRVGGTNGNHGFSFNEPDSYESWVALKTAYDNLLTKKGYENPDTTYVWSESNEYIISHNTRPSPDSVQCEECHERKQDGAFSSLVSPKGIMGRANEKKVTTIPDNRLVTEGVITLELPYMKLQANGDITENVEDILYDTKIDSYMTLLKNSSASEILGAFSVIRKGDLMAAAGPELAAKMAADFISPNSYLFQVNKGAASLRNMVAVIDGNIVNDILFPTYRGIMGKVDGVDAGVQDLLNARNYGKLRSDVFYFDVQDSAKVSVKLLNSTPIYFKVGYKGTKTAVSAINVVTADLGVTRVTTVPAENILMLQPTDDNGEGFVILKTDSLGYFVVADK